MDSPNNAWLLWPEAPNLADADSAGGDCVWAPFSLQMVHVLTQCAQHADRDFGHFRGVGPFPDLVKVGRALGGLEFPGTSHSRHLPSTRHRRALHWPRRLAARPRLLASLHKPELGMHVFLLPIRSDVFT